MPRIFDLPHSCALALAAALALALAGATPARADTTNCRVLAPPQQIGEGTPSQDVIAVGVPETILDVDVAVDITHDFIDDLRIEITSPTGTTVRLHDQGGGTGDFIIATFDDQGSPNGSLPFDSGCRMQPSGPGTLADYFGQSALGNWTLSCLDTFAGGAVGFLNEWCISTFDLAVSTPVLAVDDLLCTAAGGTGIATLSWTNTQPYDSVNIYLGGALLDTLAGTATSYPAPAQPFGLTLEFCVEPVAGTSIPCAPTCCAVTTQATPEDLAVCSTPGAVVSNLLPPAVDTIAVATDFAIADLQVQVDVTHPFIGDLVLDLAHAGTTVRLHDEDGGAGTRIQLEYWDLGMPNGGATYSCGCLMQPSGPGALSDFFGLSTVGNWSLTVDDVWTGPANIGELASWCLSAYETGSVNQLTCTTTSGSGVAQLAWTNPQTFASINVFTDGILTAVLPGTATSFAAPAQQVPSTVEFCLEPVLAGIPLAQNCCTADFLVEPVDIDDCTSASGTGVATATWANPVVYDSIRVSVNGILEATLPGSATNYTTLPSPTLPNIAAICIEGVQGGSFSAAACCNAPLLDTADFEGCRVPNVPVNSAVSPVIDILIVPSNLLIGDAEVLIDISHTFVGDLIVDLTGPNAATVRLHDEQGNTDDDLVAVFSDSGAPNGAPYACGCPLQPSGPGSLSDFANIPALGGWVLRIQDTFPGNIGFLDRWCVRIDAGCQINPPAGVACASNGIDILVTWTNPANYDSIEIVRDGVAIATLAGAATSFLDLAAPAGVHEYTVRGVDTALGCSNAGPPALGGAGITDLVFAGDQGGNNDSPTEIVAALLTHGRTPMVIEAFGAASLAAAGPVDAAWICLGTYPNEHELTSAEAIRLAELHTGDDGLDGSIESAPTAVYIESADHWAFDPPTPFQSYDGVENFSFGNLQNGNDTLVDLTGRDTGLGLVLTGFSAPYAQDSGGNDYTDRLVPADLNPDLGGNQAAVSWSGDQFGIPYDVGVFYASSIAPVLVQTWEFGGYQGDRPTLMFEYIEALASAPPPPTDDFVRGDTNDDGLANIADVVFLLGALFTPGSLQPTCPRTADTNDDEATNIADAVFMLNALFVPSSPLLPPPNAATGCGVDPTPGGVPCAPTATCP